MKQKPLRMAVILALALFALAATSFGQRSNEPTHQGKTVEEWFQEYVAGEETRISPTSTSARNGEFMRASPDGGKPDPAWQAFEALGEKAVPCLVARLRSGPHESSSATATAKPLPTARPEIPNPKRAQLERREAIDLIHRLGVRARATAPALLALLPESDEAEAEEICAALQNTRAEPAAINQLLLDLGKRHRDADVLKFAQRLGWNGPEVARLLGEMSQSTHQEICHGALALLEAAGQGARPAANQIVEVLKNPDQEIRYLAARSLSALATNTPVAIKALQALADDQNDMVRRVARRALGKTEGSASPQRR